jgi:starvation-inducible DNA-binding protein
MEMQIKSNRAPQKDSTYPKTQDYDNLAAGLSQILADTYTLQHQIEQRQQQQSETLSSAIKNELQQQQQELSTATNAIAERIFTTVTPIHQTTEFTRPSFIPAVAKTDSDADAIVGLARGHEMLGHHLLGVLSLPEAQQDDAIASFLNQRAQIHQKNAQTLRSFL